MPLVCHPDRNEVSATERNVVERYFFVRIFFTALTALTTLVGGTTFALAQTTPAPSTLPTLGVHDYLNPLPATPSAPTWDTPTPSPASNFALPAAPAPYAATTQAGAPVVPQSVSQSIATPEAPSTSDSAAAPITESKHNINVVSLPDDTAAVPKAPDGATCDAAATYAQSHPTAADCQDQLNYFRSTCVPAGYTNIFFECGARTAPAPAAPAVTWTSQPDQSPTDQCDAAAAYVKNNPSGTDCPAQMNYYTTVCMAQLHLSGFFGSCHGRSR